MKAYPGPERRACGPDVCVQLEQLQSHLDTRFDALCKQVTALEGKVNPMHEYYVTAKTGATIVKWLAYVGAPAAALWSWITHYGRP